MPSNQSAAVRRRWEASRLAMVQPGYEAPDDESWGHLTAEPRGVDCLETEAGGLPAIFLGEGTDPRDPRANPLYANLSGLSPLYIQAGGAETLADDARLLDAHARKAGVDVRLDIVPGMLHTFQMAAGRAPEADDAIRELAGWVRPRGRASRPRSVSGRGGRRPETGGTARTARRGAAPAARRPAGSAGDGRQSRGAVR